MGIDRRPGAIRRTILVAEDDDLTREALAMFFREEEGYWVVAVRDGDDLLRRLTFLRPDLILTDVRLPGMDGLEVARRLRLDPTTADLPIVAVSGADHRAEALAAGCTAFVPKPYDLDQLCATVERALGSPARP